MRAESSYAVVEEGLDTGPDDGEDGGGHFLEASSLDLGKEWERERGRDSRLAARGRPIEETRPNASGSSKRERGKSERASRRLITSWEALEVALRKRQEKQRRLRSGAWHAPTLTRSSSSSYALAQFTVDGDGHAEKSTTSLSIGAFKKPKEASDPVARRMTPLQVLFLLPSLPL